MEIGSIFLSVLLFLMGLFVLSVSLRFQKMKKLRLDEDHSNEK